MSGSRIMDVVGSNMVIKTRSGRSTQQWFFDNKTKTVKNVQSKKSFDITGNNMRVFNTNSKWNQLFLFQKGVFKNVKNDKVISVKAQKDVEGQSVDV